MMGNVRWLMEKYAGGRAICNCGRAYYTEGGTYWRTGPDGPTEHHDGKFCEGGCQAAQIRAVEYIVSKMREAENNVE